MAQLKAIVEYCNDLLRANEFRDYCPNGLRVEGKDEVQRIVCGVTACQALIDEAIEKQADAILVHHGYFWKNEDAVITGIKRNRIQALLKNNISLIAYHLPLDAHEVFGNNKTLAHKLNRPDHLRTEKTKGELDSQKTDGYDEIDREYTDYEEY